MADYVIKVKIDVKKLLKEWFFTGLKGTYLNVTILFNKEKDSYGNNGPVVQDVPKEVYKKEKGTKGPIVGNCMVFESAGEVDNESKPGFETGNMGASDDDDLPF